MENARFYPEESYVEDEVWNKELYEGMSIGIVNGMWEMVVFKDDSNGELYVYMPVSGGRSAKRLGKKAQIKDVLHGREYTLVINKLSKYSYEKKLKEAGILTVLKKGELVEYNNQICYVNDYCQFKTINEDYKRDYLIKISRQGDNKLVNYGEVSRMGTESFNLVVYKMYMIHDTRQEALGYMLDKFVKERVRTYEVRDKARFISGLYQYVKDEIQTYGNTGDEEGLYIRGDFSIGQGQDYYSYLLEDNKVKLKVKLRNQEVEVLDIEEKDLQEGVKLVLEQEDKNNNYTIFNCLESLARTHYFKTKEFKVDNKRNQSAW